MRIKKIFIIPGCFLFFIVRVAAQDIQIGSYIQDNKIETDSSIIDNDLSKMTAFPVKRFYLMAELHGVNATPVIQLALIRKIKAVTGLRFIILEMSHSNAFILNRYLQTGNAAFFAQITDARRSFWFVRNLYEMNQLLKPEEQLRFIGIDVEYSNLVVYQRAMRIMLDTLKSKTNDDPLIALLEQGLVEQSISRYKTLNAGIKTLLEQKNDHYKQLLAGDYNDLLMIVRNEFTKKGMSRDEEMFANFKNNVHGVFGLGEAEPFFASFGASHVSLVTNNKFVHALSGMYNEPVQQLCVIGTQYFNSYSVDGTVLIENDGIIPAYGTYKKRNEQMLNVLQQSWAQNDKRIVVVPLGEINKSQAGILQKLDMLIMVRNFGPIRRNQ